MIKFGTDGWRAIIAEDFTFENLKILSQAIADYLEETTVKAKRKKVVIGYDRRFLSKEFAQTVGCVLAANNIKVNLSNRDVPTPAVSLHCRNKKYDLGVMITASHNPARFNGLKIKAPEGGSADKTLTDKVESLLGKHKPKYIDIALAKKKNLLVLEDLTIYYMDFLRKFIDIKKIKKLKLKVLVDVMYGSGDNFVERALGQSNIEIDYLHNEFNPSFGGIRPEPIASSLVEMMAKMKKGKYDIGVVLDGDADRIAMVDSKGNYINAQVILPLLAIHMVKNRKVSGGIAKTVVGSNVIDKVALSLGVVCYETPVGFKYISNLFEDNLICIGGEEAGGIGFKGYIPERDGSAAFLLLLEMIVDEGKKFSTLLSDFYKKYGRYYYSRSAIPVKSIKKGLSDLKLPTFLGGKKVERVNTLDGIKLIAGDCWLMFRKSGTEPIVRVYAESKSKKESDQLVALGKRKVYVL
ncbi:MAG: phosphoglucomutase/phosphomannomutase family protein [Candidatus Omnitrophica bacterium]|nr:phosphoglucomutase/phosphomannomutase family protein [Candidatus Omnitrophota bacterium]